MIQDGRSPRDCEVASAARHLFGDRVPLAEAGALPRRPGLYAMWAGGTEVAGQLGLSDKGMRQPLYIGKTTDLRRRVTSYLREGGASYRSFREYLRFSLLTGSHALVPEWTLFGSGMLNISHWLYGASFDGPAPLALEAAAAEHFEDWMLSGIEVSVVSIKEVDALEGPLIRAMTPSMNQMHMSGSRWFETEEEVWIPEALARRSLWFIAVGVVAELILSPQRQLQATDGDLLFVWGEGGVGFTESGALDESQDDFLSLGVALPTTSAGQREHSLDAMSAWAGSTYATPDALMDRLRDRYWAPGLLHDLLVQIDNELGLASPLAGPLRPLRLGCGAESDSDPASAVSPKWEE